MGDLTELEKRILRANEYGKAWAAAEEKWLLLDKLRDSVLADLMKDLDTGDVGENKLERLAKARKEYRDHVEGMAVAKGECIRAKVRYESAVAFYEAARSNQAMEREKIAKGIYHTGG